MELPFEDYSEEHINRVIESHLDPENGTPYWLEKAEEYGGVEKAKEDIDAWEDLKEVFGLQIEEKKQEFAGALRERPYTDFLPQRSIDKISIVGESGGTTGKPKKAPFTENDWEMKIEKYSQYLDEMGVPKGVDWFCLVPSYPPHSAGQMGQSLAESRGGNALGIDLDSRAIKEFGKQGMEDALNAYMKHMGKQAKELMEYQDEGVVMTTSKVLEQLPRAIDVSEINLEGIVQGGAAMSKEQYRQFEEVYGDTPICGSFATALTLSTGVQIPDPQNYEVIYLPTRPERNMEVVDDKGNPVDYGERGIVTTSNVTEDFLMPALREEVKGTLVEPPEVLDDVDWPCVKDIAPEKVRTEGGKEGVY
ncbi:MAG: hypothetical protein ACLFQ8_02390 [Candidatus Aenigmatarchaeota archaeon]